MISYKNSNKKWTQQEIHHAAKIFIHSEKNKSSIIRILDEIVHWMLVLIILLGNLIASFLIIVVSAFINTIFLYFFVFILAILIGILIEIPLIEIEKIDKNKHFISRVLLPLLAILNIYILIGLKATMEYFSKNIFNFNPLFIGSLYAVFFLVPHLYNLVIRKIG